MPEPDPPDGAPAPPPDVTPADLKRRLDEALERLARFERDMPRVVARIAAGLTDGRPGGAAASAPKGDERIAALEKMLHDEQQRRIRTEREVAVRAAVAALPWVDPEDPVAELLSKVEERDGQLVVMGVRKFDSGESYPEAFALDEAVRQLAQRKSHWIKADVKGGSGASGGSGFSGGSSRAVAWDTLKYRDLKSNPVLMQRAIVEKGQQWVAALYDKWRQKQAKNQQFHI